VRCQAATTRARDLEGIGRPPNWSSTSGKVFGGHSGKVVFVGAICSRSSSTAAQ
jgi:hypothetical protein